MKWEEIHGHNEIVAGLKALLAGGRVPHALLFSGPDGVGKMTAAGILAAALLCIRPAGSQPCGECPSCRSMAGDSHPDFLFFRNDGSSLKIGQIRTLQQQVALLPYLGQRRVCIFEDAERMTAEAANSLLKILEEPPEYLVFILTSGRTHILLNTIVSRCRIIRFSPLPWETLQQMLADRGAASGQAAVAARLGRGCVGAALKFLAPGGFDCRDQAVQIIQKLPGGSIQQLWETAAVLEKMELNALNELLVHFLNIFRDMMLIHTGAAWRLLYNTDILDKLTDMAGGWNYRCLEPAMREVGETLRALAMNANPRLTCEALLLKLSDLTER